MDAAAIRAAIEATRPTTRAAIAHWQNGAAFRGIERAFADCPDDAEAAALRAERLLGDAGWVAALLDPLVAALAADPFFEPPCKVARDAARTGLVLYDGPALSIAASVTQAAATRVVPPRIAFTGRMTVTRVVRAGGAALTLWHAAAPGPAFRASTAPPCVRGETRALRDGAVYRIDGRTTAQRLHDAQGDVVTLVATLRAGAAPLVREHSVESGALARVASADDRASRVEMLLGFLRLAGRRDAGAAFDAATRDAAFQLRWAAMREWLVLDGAAALPRLVEMAAGDPHPDIRAAAARTLAVVRPKLERVPCLA
ncbi:hypothetical protein ACG3SL_17380 [Sphingomonas sp. CJ20]